MCSLNLCLCLVSLQCHIRKMQQLSRLIVLVSDVESFSGTQAQAYEVAIFWPSTFPDLLESTHLFLFSVGQIVSMVTCAWGFLWYQVLRDTKRAETIPKDDVKIVQTTDLLQRSIATAIISSSATLTVCPKHS